MDDISTTTAALDPTDEEILTYTVSDETLQEAAGIERGVSRHRLVTWVTYGGYLTCC
jgi:hypothetical protein